MKGCRARGVWLATVWILMAHGWSWAADPVAYITEIQRKAGEVRVRSAGATEWRAPRPLLALRPGDQVQVQGDGHVVVLFHAGGDRQRITPENSPFTIVARTTSDEGGQLRTIIASVSRFVLGKQEAPPYRRMGTRGTSQVPLIVAPRQTRLFPASPTFEWEGGEELRYTLRVVGPQGVVWEERGVARNPVVYPATAPPLTPGIPYRWELEAPGYRTERAEFEILADADASRVRDVLAALDGAKGDSPVTLVVMRTAVLFEEGLYDEARRQLDAALVAQPDEPTLCLLQGHVYQRVGLAGKAAVAFDRAEKLLR